MTSRRPKLAGTTGAVVALLAAMVSAQPAATRASDPSPQTLHQWITDLASQDSAVRSRARQDLMGIPGAALPKLRDALTDAGPIAPSQRAALQDVVAQVYLSAERDRDDEQHGADEQAAGFLGVRVSREAVAVSPAPGVRPEGTPVGVAVSQRVPGFCAYRMLQDGDVILRVGDGDKSTDFKSPDDFIAAVGRQPAGHTLTLDVLRQGKLVHVPVTLDRRPTWAKADPMEMDAAIMDRQRRAAEYWSRTFAPILGERKP